MVRSLALLLLLVGCPALAAPDIADERERFRAVTPKTFDSGGAAARQFHLEAPAYLEMATIARTGPERPLPLALREDVAALRVRTPGGDAPLAAHVADDPFVDGVIVLHRGRIVFEAYPRMAPWQRHFSWSVSKALTSAALGALVTQDRLDPDADLGTLLPELAGTVWDSIALRDVANMASGVDCRDSDGYQTNTTCIYRLEEALGLTAPTGYDDGLLAHLGAMERRGPPGERYEYVSANTTVLALVAEAVTGQSFARVLQDELWAPMGAEADGLVAISPEGFAMPHSGITLRLRDLARFGELFTRPGDFGALSEALVADMQGPRGIALTPERRARLQAEFPEDAPIRAGWQWDLVWADGAMFKGGYSGQGLYVDPERDLVVAFFGTGEDYSAQSNDLRSVARQLATSALFDAPAP